MKTILILVMAILLLFIAAELSDPRYYELASGNRIPECQEDATLVGAGQFENGTWDYYKCGPNVDDYQP